MREKPNILVYGYGNPGRKDDGLGPVFAELVEKWIEKNKIQYVSTDSNYQLNIEDAFSIRDYDFVIFVDASTEEIEDYKLTRVEPSEKIDFTMHAARPSFVLDLCKKLYDISPATYLLHIKGYEFEMEESLTKKARENLEVAFRFIQDIIKDPQRLSEVNNYS